ncbi:unnamed protein product, partial [Brenthis ino]
MENNIGASCWTLRTRPAPTRPRADRQPPPALAGRGSPHRLPAGLIQPATVSRFAHGSRGDSSSSRRCSRAPYRTTSPPAPARRSAATLVSERLTDTEHCFVAAEYATTDVLATQRATRRGRDSRAPTRRPPVRRRIF